MARSQTREKDFAGWLFEASPETGCSGGAWVEAAFCSFCYCDPGDPGNQSDLAFAALGTGRLVACAVEEVEASCAGVLCGVDSCSHTLVPLCRHDHLLDPDAAGDQCLGEHEPAPAVGVQLLEFPHPPV